MVRTTFISSGWSFSSATWRKAPGYLACSKLEWLPAQVPGHVHVDLVHNGVIGNPFEAKHELGCQWVDQETWCYRVEFVASPQGPARYRRLRFSGLDTVCEVRLNGELVAEHDNMFVPLEVDVAGRLGDGVNSLEVTFLPAVAVGERRRADYFAAEGLPSDLVRFEERAFLRKAAYMFGWDWGPRLVSAGIWQPVALLEYDARLLDVHVRQEHLPNGDVAVQCTSELEGDGRVVHFWQSSPDAAWQRFEDGQVLTLAQPERWWPNGMGRAHLHRLVSYVMPLGERADLSLRECGDLALDRRESCVGLRTVRLVQEPDAWGRSFRFEINGQPLWSVGANWIPDHSFASQTTRARLRSQLERAADMHMNMLRVWGGGLYESDDFYDLCDELGILVWQDFPFACSYSPDDPAAIAVALAEAEVAVRRLRNRASLALWCGNNENLMMFQAKWDDQAKHPPRCHGERIWDVALPALLSRLDAGRPYLATSPHSPEGAELANADVCGDQHNWDVWHGRGDWVHYRESRARFASEYGFAAAPSPAAWREAIPGAELSGIDVRDPVAQWHDKTKKGYETFLAFPAVHYAQSSNLEEWTYHSQLNQRDALCAAIEHYRSSNFCAGSLIWQLNDCWPVQSWAVLDNTGAYKAAAFALRRLYAPLLAVPHIEFDGDRPKSLRFTALLDNRTQAVTDTLRVELRDSVTGVALQHAEARVALRPGERRSVLEVPLSELDPQRCIVWFEFAGVRTFRLLCEPKALQTGMPVWTATRRGSSLVLSASCPAIDVWVCPATGDALDNFRSLSHAGQVEIPLTGPCDEVRLRWLGGAARVPVTFARGTLAHRTTPWAGRPRH